jgi:hypothetical protein
MFLAAQDAALGQLNEAFGLIRKPVQQEKMPVLTSTTRTDSGSSDRARRRQAGRQGPDDRAAGTD